MFIVGQEYSRRADIHERYGGQRQGGISTPREHPVVICFTGSSGSNYGYSDAWQGDGSLEYFGEGQEGDMRFKGGNKAIRDHRENGKALYLFETLGKGKPVRFLGEFLCAGTLERYCSDKNGEMRQGIVFRLVPVNDMSELEENLPPIDSAQDIESLRQRALSDETTGEAMKRSITSAVYERSSRIKAYVNRRADGICESCEKPAPFKRKDGSPYLEAHHIKMLSESGLDSIETVGAICPSCHRRIHYGVDGEELNKTLASKILKLEGKNK